jgi:hypothetical protein
MDKSRKINKKIGPDKEGPAGKWCGWFVIIAAGAGIGICLYLYSLHVALLMGEIKGGLLCGSDNGLGCHSVASSPYCAKASKYLKLAESGTHGIARFVFRHFPLDKSCNRMLSSTVHPGACLLGEGAACADEQGRFWEYHDIAFGTRGNISRSKVTDIASNIGLDLNAFNQCLDSGRGLSVVSEDINAAYKAGVKSTPTLFINGRRLAGVPKPWMLNEILLHSEKHMILSN